VSARDSAPVRLTILGATGSIGTSTIDLVRRDPDRYSIVALTAAANVDRLAELAIELGAKTAVVADPARYEALKLRLAGTSVEPAAGPEALVAAAARPADLVMSAIVGAAGLPPTIAAMEAGASIALANKECLVCAGAFFMATAARLGTTVLPVDSEHNAVFQVFDRANRGAIAEVILTASGGPFRTHSRAEMARVTPAQALRHPNWVMGAKVTIDSSTLMNKGLELVEAHHLFGMAPEKLSVLVHPQSAVHGLVRYADGSLLAQLGSPDMRTPIAVCLAWPRRQGAPSVPLDLARLGSLNFEAPDRERFPCLAIAETALRQGGGATNVMNAANEIAVEAFLAGRIGYLEIAALTTHSLEAADRAGLLVEPGSLAAALALDSEARAIARAELERLARAS